MFDPLGDEMKALERASAPAAFPRDLPVYARIDGRGFSRFTHGMLRPFDARMTEAMKRTALALFRDTGARAAYVQSDEISLIWGEAPQGGEHFFAGKPYKMASVLAGLATAHFTSMLMKSSLELIDYLDRLPHFDARVVSLPDRERAAQMVAWRGQDAKRNAISMIAQAYFDHGALQGKSTAEILSLLETSGVDLESYPAIARNGALIMSRKKMLPLSERERERIPEAQRPAAGHLYERSVPIIIEAAHPGKIRNLEAVLFDDAWPETAAGSLPR